MQVFALIGHEEASRCYAWTFENDQGKQEHVAVLEIAPIRDPKTAVKAYLGSLSA